METYQLLTEAHLESVCHIHMFILGTNNFQKAGKVWRMKTTQVTPTHSSYH